MEISNRLAAYLSKLSSTSAVLADRRSSTRGNFEVHPRDPGYNFVTVRLKLMAKGADIIRTYFVDSLPGDWPRPRILAAPIVC